jgi:hypothetical protein
MLRPIATVGNTMAESMQVVNLMMQLLIGGKDDERGDHGTNE